MPQSAASIKCASYTASNLISLTDLDVKSLIRDALES
jgi:hypothetical protein